MPLSETAYYILLSMNEPRHGYGIIKYVEKLTNGRIILGSGTIYTTLGKMKRDKFIEVFQDKDRKTIYEITEEGKTLLDLEMKRIKKVYQDTVIQAVFFNEKTKFRPFWSYDVLKTEQWLKEMHHKGYGLTKVSFKTRLFHFKRSNYDNTDYLVVYDKGSNGIPKRIKQESGYDAVCYQKNYYVN